ncbi:hypothetical protein CMK18_20595 [Candidatus Poribacteria bacterium]|nr:hypothetical protein [Candidatus Poribacteria bacterium]
MGLDTLKQINIADLPVTGDISGDDYLIIQGSEITARVQFKDIYITKENTTFGQEINDLYEKIDKLTTIVDAIPNVEDMYTKDQVDTKLTAKSNISEILTKPQIEESYHSKTIVDAKVQSRAAKIDVYVKSEVDQKIAGVISTINSLESEIQSIEKRLQALEG